MRVPRGWGWAGGSRCSMPCPAGEGGFQSTARYTPLPPKTPASFGCSRRSLAPSNLRRAEHLALLEPPAPPASCPPCKGSSDLLLPRHQQMPSHSSSALLCHSPCSDPAAAAPISALNAAGLAWPCLPQQPASTGDFWPCYLWVPSGPTAGIWEAGGFGEGSATDVLGEGGPRAWDPHPASSSAPP